MEPLIPVAAIQFSELLSGILQFVLVVGISFAVISLIASFVRFQILTGDFSGEGIVECEEEEAANKFQVEVLRRLAGSRTTPPPFLLLHAGLNAQERMQEAQGKDFVTEIQRYLYETIRASTRKADSVFQMDDLTVTLIAGECTRDKSQPLAERLIQETYNKLYRSASGWSGHITAHAGGAAFPENGRTMTELLEALERAFAKSEKNDNRFALAELPEPEVEEQEDEEEDEFDEEDDELEEEQADVAASGIVDPLTGVMRADRIDSAMQKLMAGYRRAGEAVSMLFFTFDRLDKYRRQYGDEVKDAMLKSMGGVLEHATRETDLIGRYGETAFIAMLDCRKEDALAVGRRICAAVRKEQVVYRNYSLRMTVSAGVSGYPGHGRTPRELLHCAQAADEEAQARGGDMAVLYEQDMKKEKARKTESRQKTVDRF